jgi:hypothetical protein
MILVTGIHISYRHSDRYARHKNKHVCRKGFISVAVLKLLGFISLVETEFQQKYLQRHG